MVDRDKIEGLIRHLRQYTAYLQEIVEQDQGKFLGDHRSIRGVYRGLSRASCRLGVTVARLGAVLG